MSQTLQIVHDPTRKYHEASTYILPHDEAEGERLNLQHQITVKAFDGKLFVAPVVLKEGDRVLESGAGTGIWILQLADQVSATVQMQAIDIGSRLFPATHPTNVQFSVNSITSLPKSWASSFAFVHQRFLTGGLTMDMWKIAIGEIFRALVPGGWVELLEIDFDDNIHLAVGPHSNKVIGMLANVLRDMQLLSGCSALLPDMLRETGFVNIHSELHGLPVGRSAGQDGIDGSRNFATGMAALKAPMMRSVDGSNEHVQNEKEFDDLIAEAKEEWLASDVKVMLYTIYAQRPDL